MLPSVAVTRKTTVIGCDWSSLVATIVIDTVVPRSNGGTTVSPLIDTMTVTGQARSVASNAYTT